jgi:NDP-sugar pyrophosphorylase family protein
MNSSLLTNPESVASGSIVLICPGARPAVLELAQRAPLALSPILGKTLLEHWLDHLADNGVRRVCLVASDRPEQLRAWLGDGVRWELKVELMAEAGELKIAEARAKYSEKDRFDPRARHDDVWVMDFLPGAPERPLFQSYAAWFMAVTRRMPQAASAPDRIGVRKLQSGVWAGMHSRISPDAHLRPPCWLGENVLIGPRAIVGPDAIVEDGTVLAADAEVANSIVGPGTYVGEFAEVKNSLASGSTLINWQTGSCIQVPDAFLLSPLDQRVTADRADPWFGIQRILFGNHA